MNDELMLLWQQGASKEPDAAEVARLCGRATMARFDWIIKRRNFMEYAAGTFLLTASGWELWSGHETIHPLLVIAAVSFVLGYLWRAHRKMTPLDSATDALSYQSAMLTRIDLQIRLLSTVRYWYVLPLFVPMSYQIAGQWWTRGPAKAVGSFVFVTALCVGVVWLNERFAVRRLRAERDKIKALYTEER